MKLPQSEIDRMKELTKTGGEFLSRKLEAMVWLERMGKFAEWASGEDWKYLGINQNGHHKWLNVVEGTIVTTPELIDLFFNT